MKTIFIAAPFRGETPWEIEQNIRLAEEVGLEVARNGMIPLIPHTMYRFFQDSLPDEFWLEACSTLLTLCDAVFFAGNWRASSGCQGEQACAREESIPCYYVMEDLVRWARGDSAE